MPTFFPVAAKSTTVAIREVYPYLVLDVPQQAVSEVAMAEHMLQGPAARGSQVLAVDRLCRPPPLPLRSLTHLPHVYHLLVVQSCSNQERRRRCCSVRVLDPGLLQHPQLSLALKQTEQQSPCPRKIDHRSVPDWYCGSHPRTVCWGCRLPPVPWSRLGSRRSGTIRPDMACKTNGLGPPSPAESQHRGRDTSSNTVRIELKTPSPAGRRRLRDEPGIQHGTPPLGPTRPHLSHRRSCKPGLCPPRALRRHDTCRNIGLTRFLFAKT